MTLHQVQSQQLQQQQQRRLIHRIFAKQYGLTLHVDAVDLLLQTLHQYGLLPLDPAANDHDELDQTLHTIAAACRRDSATTSTSTSASASTSTSTAHTPAHSSSGHSAVLSAAKLDNVLQRLKNNANQSAYSSFGAPDSQDALALASAHPAAAANADKDDIDLPSLLHVLSAFHLPRWRYSPDSKAFLRIEKPAATPSAMTPHAQAKPFVFRDRFELIRQRILRNPNFRPATFSSLAPSTLAGGAAAAASSRLLSLTPISALRGNEGKAFYLFGMLSRLDHGGKVFLEDGSASVELDLSQTSTGIGFFTETCFVIVQGTYTPDKLFFVHAISMPPAETRQATFEAFGQLDFLGAPLDVYDTAQLQAIEHQFARNAIYVISDVHLDHKPTMDALHLLLNGLNESRTPPLALVLLGNFSSTPPTPATYPAYRDLWTAFASLLADFATLAACTTFVFIPGPTDPWNAHLHPRAPLPVALVGKVMGKLARVELATSPCRVKYCGMEMVVGRGEYVGRMRRGDVVKVEKMRGARERAAAAAAAAGADKGKGGRRGTAEADGGKDRDEVVVSQGLAGSQVEATPHSYHYTRTIIDQAHLLPLPLDVQPVMWDFDHVNRLYPLPHIVVSADAADTEAYVEEYAGVTVVNPGSFSHSGMRGAGAGEAAGRFTYAKVVPGVRRVELEAVYSSSGF